MNALPKPAHAHKGYSARRHCVSFREPGPDRGPFDEIGVGGKWHHEMGLVSFWRVVGHLEGDALDFIIDVEKDPPIWQISVRT